MASQSRSEPRNRLPSPSPGSRPSPGRRCRRSRSRCTRASWSSTSRPAGRPARRGRGRARPRSRWSRTGAGATTVDAPVSALNRLDLPLLGRPTRPRRSTAPTYREVVAAPGWTRAGRGRVGRGLIHYAHRLPREDIHEQEDHEAQAALPPQQGQPRQAPELGPSVDRRPRGDPAQSSSIRTVWMARDRCAPTRRGARSRPRPCRVRSG